MGTYNLWDCVATAKILKRLREEQRSNGQDAYYRERVWPLIDVGLAVQAKGLRLDPLAIAKLDKQYEPELDDTEGEIRSILGNEDLNLNSPKQKAQVLYGTLGLKCPKRTEGGDQSTDQEALLAVLQKLPPGDSKERRVLELLFHRSRLNTILTRYLSLRADPDGRVRPTVKMHGAETGRWAYADPALQQYPREVRAVIVAGEGMTFVAADFSQLEARILAVVAKDLVSLAAFANGEDIHAANAQDLFGVAAWEAADKATRKGMRDFAKGFLYGISYGGSPETMKTKTFCPCPKCVDKVPQLLNMKKGDIVRASQRWFVKHNAIMHFREALEKELRAHHRYVSPFGRVRFFTTPWPSVKRELYNCPMQTTAAEWMNDCALRLHETWPGVLALQMHDQLVLEVPLGEHDLWAGRLREIMERPVPQLDDTIFPVDMSHGTCWADL